MGCWASGGHLCERRQALPGLAWDVPLGESGASIAVSQCRWSESVEEQSIHALHGDAMELRARQERRDRTGATLP